MSRKRRATRRSEQAKTLGYNPQPIAPGGYSYVGYATNKEDTQ